MDIRTALLAALAILAGFGVATSDKSGRAEEGMPYRAYLVSAARDGQATVPDRSGEQHLPPLPQGWPTTLGIGLADPPGGAPEAAKNRFGFRYQYLAGGANTGTGWATWAPNGSFVTDYIRESAAAGIVPIFTYYMVRHSLPGAANSSESQGVAANLTNPTTMRALFEDLELFFRRAAESGAPLVVLHFEPDIWGFLNQRAKDDDASTVEVAVGSSGHPTLTDLPDSATGLAAAVIRLRDTLGANTLVAYHMSSWGGGSDLIYSDPSDREIDQAAKRAATFYGSLNTKFDIAFAEMSDRDAAFKQFIYGDGGASWWDEGDFQRHTRFLEGFVQRSQLRVVLWQIPLGNTLMRAMNNRWNHYQDNKVEWLLGDAALQRLQTYADSGVVSLLFGRGADGATCACDANADGVTNPAAINGNVRPSITADDDGGYFDERTKFFGTQSPIALR
jgi:hypothetical protein